MTILHDINTQVYVSIHPNVFPHHDIVSTSVSEFRSSEIEDLKPFVYFESVNIRFFRIS
jgi:hypothetical protein